MGAGVSLETIPETGAPSASSSLIQEPLVERSPPQPSHPAEGIGVLSTSGAANASISKTPNATREGTPGDNAVMGFDSGR